MHNNCSMRAYGGPDRCPACQQELEAYWREEWSKVEVKPATKEDFERLGLEWPTPKTGAKEAT